MGARARQPQDEPGPSDLHQFDRATFLAARCHGRDRHFHEHRPTRTTAACRPASLKSAFQIVVTELQPRRRGAQPVVPRTLGRRLPEFLRDALAPSPARSPRRETLRQRLLAAVELPSVGKSGRTRPRSTRVTLRKLIAQSRGLAALSLNRLSGQLDLATDGR